MDRNTEYENLKKEIDEIRAVHIKVAPIKDEGKGKKLLIGESSNQSEIVGYDSEESNQDRAELAPDSGEGSSKSVQTRGACETCFLKEMNHTYKDEECVVLKCEGDEEVAVPIPLAVQSGYIRNALEVGINDDVLPVPLVPVKVLYMLLEYWNIHVGEDKFDEEKIKQVKEWEENFFHRIGTDNMFDLFVGANYIDARGCLERGTDFVAELIRKMNVYEIREHFGMKNDFTPEEEEQLKKDFPWAYEEI